MALSKDPFSTPRGREFLTTLLDYGILSFDQVQTLFFPESVTATENENNRRYGVSSTVYNWLFSFEKSGYVILSSHEETARFPNMRVVWLSRKGASVLADEMKLPVKALHWQKPHSRLTQIPHDLMANTFRLKLTHALTLQDKCSLNEWVSGRLLAADGDTIEYTMPVDGRRVSHKRRIVADSFCILMMGDIIARYPIEIDYSTLSQTRIMKEKIHAGIAYIHSPQYKKRYGENRGRWLFVMESKRRMENLQETVVRELGKVPAAAFYFTTFDALNGRNILTDPIWFLGGAAQTPQSLLYALENRV
jgi:protein involved in plasmid replication-relaxation